MRRAGAVGASVSGALRRLTILDWGCRPVSLCSSGWSLSCRELGEGRGGERPPKGAWVRLYALAHFKPADLRGGPLKSCHLVFVAERQGKIRVLHGDCSEALSSNAQRRCVTNRSALATAEFARMVQRPRWDAGRHSSSRLRGTLSGTVSNPMGIPDKAVCRPQIKSRERVRDLAEVYTHEREVNAMLDLVPAMLPSEVDPGNTDRTFLEPACGHGNFLVAILARKLRYVTPSRYGRGERFEHRVLRCLASIYGIDISAENVTEARERMWAEVGEHLATHGATETTQGFRDAIDAILSTNVIQADTLADAAKIELVAYESGASGTFIREWSLPLDPSASEPNLFAPVPRRDEVPIHYSALARQTEPTIADSSEREAA